MPALRHVMQQLELRFCWRPLPEMPMPDRIYRLAEGLLSLKELEYLGHPQTGNVPSRTSRLIDRILHTRETRHDIRATTDSVPERVKEIRRVLIGKLQQPLTPSERLLCERDLQDMFFVMQLFSYPGDYVSEEPSIERMAETIDKLEEDVLSAAYPSVKGRRRVAVQFGEPILVPRERQRRDATAQLSKDLHSRVQAMIDAMRKVGDTISRP